MGRRYALRDDQWDAIKGLLPGREESVGASCQDSSHPAETHSDKSAVLRQEFVRSTPSDREFFCQAQTVSGHRNALRQNRSKLPCRHPPGGSSHLANVKQCNWRHALGHPEINRQITNVMSIWAP